MNEKYIVEYYGNQRVFKFDGSREELADYCQQNNIGYSYIIVNFIVYFVVSSGELVSDTRISQVVESPAEPQPS